EWVNPHLKSVLGIIKSKNSALSGVRRGAASCREDAMSRSTMVLFWSLLVLTAGFLLAAQGCGGSGGSGGGGSNPLPMPGPSSGKIQHVVVIFQENRTP